MLVKIELENFFSIRDRICIDFRAGNTKTALSKKLSDNVVEWKGLKLLKSIGLFGANASGKSNILKAINFCCRMVLESHLHNENSIFNYAPFKFEGYPEKPSCFLIDFICDDVEYEYSFSLLKSKIISESLFYYPNDRRARVFERDGSEYKFAESVLARPNDVAVNTSDKNLFLSRASSMNRELAQKLYRYFLSTFMLGLIPLQDMNVESYFDANKPLILAALQQCDSDICDIEKKIETVAMPMSVPGNPFGAPGRVMNREFVRFVTYHKIAPNVLFDIDEESGGTKRLFSILLRMIDVVKNKKSVMLDEFDTSLHASISEFLLDLIHASSQSQLLFSSHNLSLINMNRFRKDQIVFVTKNETGATEVQSLYDYKDFRENMDAEKAYRQGRFDAIPIVTSTVESLKRMLAEG
jgi:hypothetical protein